jgi:hypothetical protein
MAVVGSILKVMGSSSAMVAGGPRPGSTPIIVPKTTPTKHQKRFAGVSAIENPKIRLLSASTVVPVSLQKPQGPAGKETPRATAKIT